MHTMGYPVKKRCNPKKERIDMKEENSFFLHVLKDTYEFNLYIRTNYYLNWLLMIKS